jgi:hypothetical protein
MTGVMTAVESGLSVIRFQAGFFTISLKRPVR